MSEYQWPDPATRPLLGKRISRVDGPVKVSGRAKYTYDYNPDGLLAGKILRCPYAHARITSIDTSAAEKMPGVKAVRIIQPAGTEIFWAGDEVAAVAAVDELTAEDAIRAIKVQYEVLPHFVSDAEPPKNVATQYRPRQPRRLRGHGGQPGSRRTGHRGDQEERHQLQTQRQVPEGDAGVGHQRKRGTGAAQGEVRRGQDFAFSLQENRSAEAGRSRQGVRLSGSGLEGLYGASCITHCCLETHGMAIGVAERQGLVVHVSTQNLSGIAPQVAEPLGIPAGNIQVLQQYVGGGFGSKFGPDRWGIATAQLSKAAGGKPVKIMLERAAEQEVAGMRPSGYARVKIAADKDGKLVAWESRSWGTGGIGGGGTPPLPYIFEIPNQRKQNVAISTNQGSARAWRAPDSSPGRGHHHGRNR